METPFPFGPFQAFGTMSIFLLTGIFLRAKIKFFQNFMIPSCIIGGMLGIIVINLNILPMESEIFEAFVYHFFTISFISIGLTYNRESRDQKEKTKSMFKGATWMAAIEGVTISLQAIVGCLFVLGFGYFGVRLFPTFGLFIPLGFTEGPGQALSFGQVWEYIVPIALMSIVAAALTTWVILYLGRRIDTLNFERTMTIFGTCTGTVSTGLLLLRVIDPEFRTPVALEIGLMNMVAMPIIVASMVLVNATVWWGWDLWLVIGAHVFLLAISVILIRLIKMWGKPKF